MRKIIFMHFLFMALFSPLSWALSLIITATGDNYLYYYDWADGVWAKLDEEDYDSWKTPASISLDWEEDHQYFLFAAKNRGTGSSGNPAGLLAQIELNGQVLLSDSSWEVLAVPSAWSGTELSDPQDYFSQTGWQPAQWYAANSGEINPLHPEADGTNDNDTSFWYEENGNASIPGIDARAKWIWTEKNFSSDMDKGAIFRVEIPTPNAPSNNSVVPEPSSFFLLVFGLPFVVTSLKRKR